MTGAATRYSPDLWQEIIRLGERLMSLATGASRSMGPLNPPGILEAQRSLILRTTVDLLEGEAELWLSPACFDGPAWKMSAAGVDDLGARLNPKPGTLLMQWVMETGEICSQPTGGPPATLVGSACYDPDKRFLAVAVPLTVVVPLADTVSLADHEFIGVLQVTRPADHPLRLHQIEILEGLASTASTALRTTRRIVQEHWRAEQITIIAEVSNAISSILDEDELLSRVVELVLQRFGYPYIHLFTVQYGQHKIIYQAGNDPRRKELEESGFAYDLDDPQGIIPWVARHGQTITANDVNQEARYRPSPLPPDNTAAEMAVPLIFGGEVLGVLDIQSDQINAFTGDDSLLFETLADHIATALRNANLYRSEKWRRQVADSLHQVAGLLSADVDLDQVLTAVLAELRRNLPCDLAAIWLQDTETGAETNKDSAPDLILAAVLGDEFPEEVLCSGTTPEDVCQFYLDSGGSLSPESCSAWLDAALASPEPLVRSPQVDYEPLGLACHFPADYSALAVGLRIGSQLLGVLTLAHHTSGRYGREASAMAATFASYASVAIENARLYEAAHDQAWVSTVLLQVAEATQDLTTLNELLSTVVHITPMLAGVTACAVYMLDELEDAFIPAASEGLSTGQRIEFERWRFAAGDSPALDLLRQEKQPVVFHGLARSPQVEGVSFTNQPADLLPGSELMVLIPLLARGELLGALLVDYSNDHAARSSPAALERMIDERLAIVQGIAHQTAVAVENIRLLKAQKEEAYISVALLQVAQTVASSGDLEDTLGAIVRLTPILAGVRRSALFLWERERLVFRLSQVYGLPRAALGREFALGEFDLLDSVVQLETLVAYPVDQSATPPAQPAEADQLAQWEQVVLEEVEAIDAYLEQNQPLLLAFPLAVKGEVLGVLLVEEPGGSGGLGAVHNQRQKRIEILTGITQQAALAVQSDRLQREMVERERLEREFQLAREIQEALLPEEFPPFSGCDLAGRWHTAREVGGDFYDAFLLPGDRLGLVIGDVADKGMPAALFMALVRTLVRATAQETLSPGEVLRRVNDALIPNARQGMFVTIVYAVLELDTGRLVYGNAGHNPPLIVRRKTLELEQLVRCGMALGIEESDPIEERTVHLDPGDTLIFYTDGVTEARSPQGEYFGESRLIAALLAELQWEADLEGEAASISAQELVDALDDAAGAFIGDQPLEDDLTWLVLRRLAAETPS